MSVEAAFKSLQRFPSQLAGIVNLLPDEVADFVPDSGNWSILQIVCHLADEDEFDFPVRIRLMLAGAERWPPIDPEGWAVERDYASQSLGEQLQRFARLRSSALDDFASMQIPNSDWNKQYEHEELGTFRAGDILHSWASHDILHLRQISKRIYEFNQQQADDFSTRYAGDW